MIGRSTEIIGVIARIHFRRLRKHHLLGIFFDEIVQFAYIYVRNRAHQRRRLQFAAVIRALFIAAAGQISHVAVARAVNVDFRFHINLPALAAHGNILDLAALHIYIADIRMQQHFNVGFQQLFKQNDLKLLMIIERYGVMHRAPAMAKGRVALSQRIHQLLCDAGSHGVAVLIQITQQGQTNHKVAAHITVLLHQKHLGAIARSRQRSRNTARAGADHTHIVLTGLLIHFVAYLLIIIYSDIVQTFSKSITV